MQRSAACARRLASLLEACSTSYSAAAPAAAATATAAARTTTTPATTTGAAASPIAAAAAAAAAGAARAFRSSAAPRDLRAFIDETPAEGQDAPTYGRAWKAAELRLKSWDDLHALWYVSLRERNLLETRMLWCGAADPARQAEREGYARRRRMVKLTMNRVKQVLSERACQELHPRRAAEMRRVIHLM